jgi:uncharacterized protein
VTTMIAAEPAPILEIAEPVREILPPPLTRIRKPRVWTAFATLFLAVIASQLAVFAAMFTVSFIVGIIMGAQGADGSAIQARANEIVHQPFMALMLSLFPVQLGMLAVLLLAVRRSKQPLRQRLGLLPQTGRVFGGFKLAALAAFTFSTAMASFIVSSLLLQRTAPHNPIGNAIADGSWWTITLLSILLSVIPALVEESLFRGYLQRRFLQRWSPAVAIGVSTLLFASLHFDSQQHMLAVVPLGLITGLLAYRTNSIKPGMVVHGIHNAAVVGFAALGNVLSARLSEEALGLGVIGTIGVLFLIGLPAAVSLVRSAKSKRRCAEPICAAVIATGVKVCVR